MRRRRRRERLEQPNTVACAPVTITATRKGQRTCPVGFIRCPESQEAVTKKWAERMWACSIQTSGLSNQLPSTHYTSLLYPQACSRLLHRLPSQHSKHSCQNSTTSSTTIVRCAGKSQRKTEDVELTHLSNSKALDRTHRHGPLLSHISSHNSFGKTSLNLTPRMLLSPSSSSQHGPSLASVVSAAAAAAGLLTSNTGFDSGHNCAYMVQQPVAAQGLSPAPASSSGHRFLLRFADSYLPEQLLATEETPSYPFDLPPCPNSPFSSVVVVAAVDGPRPRVHDGGASCLGKNAKGLEWPGLGNCLAIIPQEKKHAGGDHITAAGAASQAIINSAVYVSCTVHLLSSIKLVEEPNN
ncbi:hypothetical protein Q8A73_008300 [Channa argus]|nr:hypothetical protein Q8A73_008300 [Channa argus]